MRSGRLGFFILIALLLVAHVTQAQDTTLLQLGVPQFQAEFLYTEDLIARFENEHPGVQVNIVEINQEDYFAASSAADVDAYLETLRELASAADVLAVDNAHMQPAATRAGVYLDLSPLVSADVSLNIDDFFPAAWQAYQWDGGVWGIPASAEVISVAYDPAAFDAAGLTYPDGNWTVDDLARAARALTQYDSDGSVSQPGLVIFDQYVYNAIFRSILGRGFYDASTQPESPSMATPELEAMLTTWAELIGEGVIGAPSGNLLEQTNPLVIGGSFIYFTAPDSQSTLEAAPLPGGSIALETNGFAVSAGTQYPELAYELAKWLTSQPEVTTGFNSTTPARRSMRGVTPQPADNQGGGAVRAVFAGAGLPENVQSVIDSLLETAISSSELRYGNYVQDALSAMTSDGLDARGALQQSEAQAASDLQAAAEQQTTIIVAAPEPEVVLAAGEIALNFGMAGPGFLTANSEQWDAVIDEFIANDPQVGQVNVADGFGQDITASDCYYMPNNDVPNADLSTLLSLDPFLDADPSFDSSDIVGNIMSQVQRENRTWALPIILQPGVLQYDSEQFQRAGVIEPTNGWTADDFDSALRGLLANSPDAAPFVPQGDGGLYLLQLIAAYGGLPLDFRTNPPTIDFTSPQNVEAIRQVLDLAKAGYIEYAETSGFAVIRIGGGEGQTAAIYPDSFFGFLDAEIGGGQQQNPYRMTTYPSGSQYTPLALNIGTAYINATTQYADACYRLITMLSRQPELFGGMPARYSVLNDPSYTASQNPETLATYNRIAELTAQPNTVIFPSLGGGSIQNFLLQYWLNRAFDRYVLEDADLEVQLAEAETLSRNFQQCVSNLPPYDPSMGNREEYAGQMQQCATSVDPELSSIFGGN